MRHSTLTALLGLAALLVGALGCGGSGANGCKSGSLNDLCGGDSIPGDPNTLYDPACNVVRVCATGCMVGTYTWDTSGNKLPVADECAPCPRGSGFYCAGDGLVGDAGTLYHCTEDVQGANVVAVLVCPNGCQIVPNARADFCVGADGGGLDGG